MVIAPASPVREGPSRTLKTAFELHEGTTVRVLEAQGDVARVRLLNGLAHARRRRLPVQRGPIDANAQLSDTPCSTAGTSCCSAARSPTTSSKFFLTRVV